MIEGIVKYHKASKTYIGVGEWGRVGEGGGVGYVL
jgi:hypothetical protein